MKLGSMRWVAFLLISSVAVLTVWPSDVQAMLVPSQMAQTRLAVDRSQDMKTIQTTLESKVLREKLHKMGLSDAEIQSRLSRLSDQQIHQLASQIRAVHPAGDVLIGILIAVLLVVLIIYLIKRI